MNVGLLDGNTVTSRVTDPCAWRDDELLGTEVHDEVLRHVVADAWKNLVEISSTEDGRSGFEAGSSLIR